MILKRDYLSEILERLYSYARSRGVQGPKAKIDQAAQPIEAIADMMVFSSRGETQKWTDLLEDFGLWVDLAEQPTSLAI